MLNEQYIRSSLAYSKTSFILEEEILYLHEYEKMQFYTANTLTSKVYMFSDVSEFYKKQHKKR